MATIFNVVSQVTADERCENDALRFACGHADVFVQPFPG